MNFNTWLISFSEPAAEWCARHETEIEKLINFIAIQFSLYFSLSKILIRLSLIISDINFLTNPDK
jgi:hypothetical protein